MKNTFDKIRIFTLLGKRENKEKLNHPTSMPLTAPLLRPTLLMNRSAANQASKLG